ncbi:MAG: hypothetical protein J2P55_09915 [Rhizobiales bacterium]|nr:hypothetical protein [Hyphomicrobiales bacterium]
MENRKFFHPRFIRISELILHCYRLARFYGTDPNVFLDKPVSEVLRHIARTEELAERQALEASIDNG